MANKARAVKAQFEAEGISIAQWARARGFNVVMVYRVIAGTVKGKRGEAHRIAIELGLKPRPKGEHFRPMVDAA